jgi:hypothetical protein
VKVESTGAVEDWCSFVADLTTGVQEVELCLLLPEDRGAEVGVYVNIAVESELVDEVADFGGET